MKLAYAITILVWALFGQVAAAFPLLLDGSVRSAGMPLNSIVDMKVGFYVTDAGGSLLYETTVHHVELVNGAYTLELDLTPAAAESILKDQAPATFVETKILPLGIVFPRQKLGVVPSALRIPVDPNVLAFDASGKLKLVDLTKAGEGLIQAVNAGPAGILDPSILPNLGGELTGPIGPFTLTAIGGVPFDMSSLTVGNVLIWNGAAWTGGQIPGANGGTVTQVNTGNGLAGGPITATGTVDFLLNAGGALVKNLGSGTNEVGIGAGLIGASHVANNTITNIDIGATSIPDTMLAPINSAGAVADSALSANVTMAGTAIDLNSAETTGILAVGNGGTGVSALTGIVKGTGTTALTTAVAGVDFAIPSELAASDGSPSPALSVDNSGNVGIGATAPYAATLEVNGQLKIGVDLAASCASAADGGRTRYLAATGYLQFCDGTGWKNIGQSDDQKEVSPFNAASCPTGWVPADGSGSTADVRGQFIRGLNDFGTGARADGSEDPEGGGRALASFQLDQMQGHKHTDSGHTHQTPANTISKLGGGYFTNGIQYGWTVGGADAVTSNASAALGDPTDSGTGAGTPKLASETRPRNVGLIFCQRQ